jgi:CubicO group peptidase (beta-lactamase class C family)
MSDILWHNSSTNETEIWLMEGRQIKKRVNVLFEDGTPAIVGLPWRIAGTGEFGGDGVNDIVWHNDSTNETQIWFMDGRQIKKRATVVGEHSILTTPGGVPAPQPVFVGLPWRIVGAGDFTGDGKADIVWHNGSTNETQIWFMDGHRIKSRNTVVGEHSILTTPGGVPVPQPVFVGLPWSIVGVGDFTGDGTADIVWHNDSTNETQIWFMDGHRIRSRATVVGEHSILTTPGGVPAPQPVFVGLPWRIVGAGDFTGDERADIVWHNGSTNETQIWFMAGHQIESRATVVGETSILTTPGGVAAPQPVFVGLPWRIVGIERGFWADEVKAMNKVVTDFMVAWGVPGASIAITKDGRLVYAKGFGEADSAVHEAVTIHHRFRIASVSKPITAATIMRLVDLGMLSLSDRIFGAGALLGTSYGTLPYSANIDQITVQHLLEHEGGGWSRFETYPDPMFDQPAMNHGQLISWVLDHHPLTTAPGTNSNYSNFGYCVLGRVIEKVTGRSYESAARQFLLDAAGTASMTVAGNTLAERQVSEVVYYGQNEEDPYDMQVRRMDSHGGWIGSAIDLARFVVRVDGFSTKADLLSPASITTMTTPSATDPNYAKGWGLNGANWWHGGSLPGTTSILVRTGSGLCWVALLNTRRPGIDGALDAMMWKMVGQVSMWPGHDLF